MNAYAKNAIKRIRAAAKKGLDLLTSEVGGFTVYAYANGKCVDCLYVQGTTCKPEQGPYEVYEVQNALTLALIDYPRSF